MISIEQAAIAEETQEQQTASAPIPEADREFNWRNCWYPVTFLQDMPKNRPYSFSLYDEPFVLFADKDGKLGCVVDRCPHRAAKLSDGQIIDGKLECLYHGWQFGVDGECLHIPQLPAEAKIPARACVQSFKLVERQGIVWVWAGDSEAADEALIPIIEEIDNPEFVSTDVMCSLPYDQSYFIENLLDPAHTPISHHGTIGNRKDAQPLEIEITERTVQGFRGRYRRTNPPNMPWAKAYFLPPNFIHYQHSDPQQVRVFGTALYSIPLGQNQCRILVRNYQNFSTWKVKLKPRWLDHWYRNDILDEDLQQVAGQKIEIERTGRNIKELYLPLKTCDTFVIEYRKWLDKVGSSLPFYQGYSTSKQAGETGDRNQKPAPTDRYSRHTLICSSCHQAYQLTNKLKQAGVGAAIAMAALAIVTDGIASKMSISASLLAVILAVVAEQFKIRFERTHTRH